MLLINAVGFLCCSAVVMLGVKSVYAESQIQPDPNDYPENIPLENRNITADVVGLGVEIVGYGLDRLDDATEKVCTADSTRWIRNMFKPMQFKPDGMYFKNANGESEYWDGYGDDEPKTQPGKFEMEI
jgi:hypothetical protein